MSEARPTDRAERIREACIEAALAGYEEAAIAGVCGEGALEMAIGSMRRLDLADVLAAEENSPDRKAHPAC